MPMDPDQVKEWKAGYEFVNNLQLEEARKRSVVENLELVTILSRNFETWPFGTRRTGDHEFMDIWQDIREKWRKKHA